jgi:16S rRNA (cytosine967-C5)-methyltransferase
MRDAQRLATIVVERVLSGATLPAALESVVPPRSADRRRALVQELCFGTLRHWGLLDALVRRLATKPIADPALHCLVAVAIYQLLHTRAPSFAVVDHAVNAAAMLTRPAAKALVNALLRRFLRERDALLEAVRANPVARWSHPQWWIDRVERELPADWQDVLAAEIRTRH